MPFTRRLTLGVGLGTIAGLGLAALMPRAVFAQMEGTDSYPSNTGEITIHPVQHASFVMTVPGLVIYNDPVGGAAAYEGLPAPDLILVSHEHGDHFDVPTLTALAADKTRLVTNPAVFGKLPEGLKGKAQAIANGDSTSVGSLAIDAIPAYNMTADRTQFHPQGRDNGYVLTADGKRMYVAGDTEDTPEMRALTDIYIAFVPMNLPYTMDVEQAASGVAAFKPNFVYPYHYRGSNIDAFETLLAAKETETEVRRGNWYAG